VALRQQGVGRDLQRDRARLVVGVLDDRRQHHVARHRKGLRVDGDVPAHAVGFGNLRALQHASQDVGDRRRRFRGAAGGRRRRRISQRQTKSASRDSENAAQVTQENPANGAPTATSTWDHSKKLNPRPRRCYGVDVLPPFVVTFRGPLHHCRR
jgi:hypothetical protein